MDVCIIDSSGQATTEFIFKKKSSPTRIFGGSYQLHLSGKNILCDYSGRLLMETDNMRHLRDLWGQYVLYKHNDLWGVKHLDGRQIFEPQWINMEPVDPGLFKVSKPAGSGYYYMDIHGREYRAE